MTKKNTILVVIASMRAGTGFTQTVFLHFRALTKHSGYTQLKDGERRPHCPYTEHQFFKPAHFTTQPSSALLSVLCEQTVFGQHGNLGTAESSLGLLCFAIVTVITSIFIYSISSVLHSLSFHYLSLSISPVLSLPLPPALSIYRL